MGIKVKKVKSFLSKVLTLSYPKWRFFIFLGILILLLVLPFSLIEKTHELSLCSFLLGKYCYSIGITRGVSMILKGDFASGIEYNILSIFVLVVLVIFIIHDFYKGFIKSKK
jgi:uncharacterized protein DUF2752